MKDKKLFTVSTIRFPSYSVAGHLCGVPTIEVRLGVSGRQMTQHDIVDVMQSYDATFLGQRPPRWVSITGRTEQASIDLLLAIRHLTGKTTYIECDPELPLKECGNSWQVPPWDHICLRPTLPFNGRIECPIVHSVIVDASQGPVAPFARLLDSVAPNAARYILNNPDGVEYVAKHPSDWRLTEPVRPAVRASEGERVSIASLKAQASSRGRKPA